MCSFTLPWPSLCRRSSLPFSFFACARNSSTINLYLTDKLNCWSADDESKIVKIVFRVFNKRKCYVTKRLCLISLSTSINSLQKGVVRHFCCLSLKFVGSYRSNASAIAISFRPTISVFLIFSFLMLFSFSFQRSLNSKKTPNILSVTMLKSYSVFFFNCEIIKISPCF